MGHLAPLTSSQLDRYLEKALDLKCPNVVIPVLKNHRALMYFPEPKIITNMFKFHQANKDWASMKTLFNAIYKK
jgi:hypothetical protein